MPRKYLPLTRPRQIKPGTILVDFNGDRRMVLQIMGDKVLLSHKNNPAIAGKTWSIYQLINIGQQVRQ